jgi:hypothetical protein
MDINSAFTYHAPKDDQTARYITVRETAKQFAHLLDQLCPPSSERTLALRKLQECVMWANASIAMNEQ